MKDFSNNNCKLPAKQGDMIITTLNKLLTTALIVQLLIKIFILLKKITMLTVNTIICQLSSSEMVSIRSNNSGK